MVKYILTQKLKMLLNKKLPLKNNIPIFHHSMWVAHKQNATYKLIISNDYTISET